MPKNLLQIANAVVGELGLPQLASIVGATDQTAIQLYYLINRAGDSIYQEHPWIVSQAQHIVEIDTPITTTGDVTAGNSLVTNIPSTAGIVADQFVIQGDGILTSTRVIEVVDATTLRIDQYPTETGVGVDLIIARDTYNVPEDFKWFANQTMWDRTNHWSLIGPLSPQAWQWETSGIVTVGPRRRWRQIGAEPTNWRLWPPPTATGDYPATLIFEYNSKYWASNAAGVPIPEFTADTDYPRINDQAMILETKWRLWAAKGFEFGAMQAEANAYIDRLGARDGGAPDQSLAKRTVDDYLITPWNAPDGSWPPAGSAP